MITRPRSLRASAAEASLGVRVLGLGLAAVVLGTVALHSAGRLPLIQAVAVLFAPLLLVAVGFRPAWLILLLIGIPPGLLNVVKPGMLLLLVVGALLAQVVVRGTAYLGLRSGLLPLVILIGAAFFFDAEVGADAALAGSTFLKHFSYYVAISAVSYNAVRLGELRRDALTNALLAGMFGTALIKVALTGLAPASHEGPGSLSALYFGRHFAYLAVVGYSVAFARWMVRRSEGRGSPLDLALAAFFLLFIATSLVRGPWVSALLVLLIVTWYAGRRSYWLLVPLALALVLTVPVARERVAPSASGRVDITTGRWHLWTTLWEDHISPALPTGNGFGYAWSLTPERVFGFKGFGFEGDRFLYPHNDFLFWMLEFGLWGLAIWLLYWTHLMVVTRWLLKKGELPDRNDVLIVVGIFVPMLVAQLVANGYAIQPLAERFFVAAGFVFGARAVALSRPTDSSMVG